MKKLNKAAIIVSKVLEVISWISTVLSVILSGLSIANKPELFNFFGNDFLVKDMEITEMGFTVESLTDEPLTMGAYVIFFITTFFINFGFAMIFRNVYLIMKTTDGKTKFTKGQTPFQPDNIRMIREIGIFFIALTVIEFLASVVARIVLGEGIDVSTDFYFVFMGIIIICLSQYFDYGMKLQNDTDGLI